MNFFYVSGLCSVDKNAGQFFKRVNVTTKRQLLMRINATMILMTIFLLKVSASGSFAQNITLVRTNASLKGVFAEIEKQTGYNVFYKSAQLKNSKPVTVNLLNIPLKEALLKILDGQGLDFSLVEKTVVIKVKEKTVVDRIQDVIRSAVEASPESEVNGFSKQDPITGRVTDSLGNPLQNATVKIVGTNRATLTDNNGRFTLRDVPENAILQISYLGYRSKEINAGDDIGTIVLSADQLSLQAAEVTVSTGLQQLPRERATGSFAIIDSALFKRKVSTTVLERLDGITSGVYFTGHKTDRVLVTGPTSNIGFNIRGQSTLSDNVSKSPLIILDNFPYEGTLENLNPNDVIGVSVLKDAAAASIWGSRSGNGVIVITTKKGLANQKPVIEFNSNVTIGNKPDLYKDKKFLDASTYIDIEKYLYSQNYFNADITNTTTRPALSPVVDILASSLSQSEKDAQIDALRQMDYRSDYENYFYQKAINQQHSLSIRGGGNKMIYAFSVGYDNNRDNLINNGYNRITLNAQNTYTPINNLDITTALNYTKSKTLRNNQVGYGSIVIGNKYGNLYPYADLVDNIGNALPIVKDYRTAYLNSTAELGFLDWKYRPLDEMNNFDSYDKTNNLLARISARYKFTSFLNAELLYQNEAQTIDTWEHYNNQTYYARNLINRFSIYNASTQTFTYNLPNGGILNQGSYERSSNNGRLQLNYDQNFNKKHQIAAIAGSEIREFTTRSNTFTSYGYDDEYGTANTRLNYNTIYPTNPSGNATIGTPVNGIGVNTNRFLSYYANAAYTYIDRYTTSLSGRKDGANIFGVKINDKVTPLWSAGVAWTASKERFYQLNWLPYLKLRATYGFNGNVYNGSAYTTGFYSTSADLTGAQIISTLTAPNPELRWEKVKNINIGVDFASKRYRINGSLELWQKDGLDLINDIPIASSTGFVSFTGNSAHTRTKGMDLNLDSRNLEGPLKWNTTLLLNLLKDKVVKYNITQTNTSIQTYNGVALVGKPLYSVFSYKWAGLDPTNGDPQGYLNGEVSKNYTGIINNFNPDSLSFNGSARPTVFGAIRNDFDFHGFSLSFNITYKLGYAFRRPTTSTNYSEVLSLYGYSDAADRWQQPGDENTTNVPSFIYASNTNRNRVYQYSEVLVEKADHIRLQDIRLGYNLTKNAWKSMPFRSCQIYTYASNLGILWRANKYGIDPDVVSSNLSYSFPNPFTVAFGLNISL